MTKRQSQGKQRRLSLQAQERDRRRWRFMIGGAALVVLALFASFSLFGNSRTPAPGDTVDPAQLEVAPEVGALAPDFELVSNQGESFTLSQYRGRPVAVMFMHTW